MCVALVTPEQTAFLSAARRREGALVCYSVKDGTAVGLRGGDDRCLVPRWGIHSCRPRPSQVWSVMLTGMGQGGRVWGRGYSE